MNKINYSNRVLLWAVLTVLNLFAYFVAPNGLSLFMIVFCIIHMIIFTYFSMKEGNDEKRE